MITSAELKREVERGSTFTLTSDLSCIASVLFVKCQLRYTGNQPQSKIIFSSNSSEAYTHLLWSLRKFNFSIYGKGKSSSQGWG